MQKINTILQSSLNWLIKLIFYFRFLILKRGNKDIPTKILNKYPDFESNRFHDGQWNEYLEWYLEDKTPQDWNTYKYSHWHANDIPGFWRRYGRFDFNVKLDGLVSGKQWPAIWLFEIKGANDEIQDQGYINRAYYYEIDIELFKDSLGYTLHLNHEGGKNEPGYHKLSTSFHNKKLWRKLQSEYHLYTIDWNSKWIRYYIDNILTAQFRNDFHTSMKIIMSQLTMHKVTVTY